MSWSLSLGSIPRVGAEEVIADAALPEYLASLPADDPDYKQKAAAICQIQTAKAAALEIVKGMPGPFISVTLSGHANGTGWEPKEGWSDESINVSVNQQQQEYK